MIRAAVSCLSLIGLLAGGVFPSPAAAVDNCRVRVGREGTIGISASKVTGVALWGGEAGDVTNSLVDPASCTAGTSLRNCLIGAEGTLASKTPPASCELHLADDGPDTCSVRIRRCTPGLREGGTQTGAVYRWTVFNSYSQAFGWYGNNRADLFGGVIPSTWGDGTTTFASVRPFGRRSYQTRMFAGSPFLVVVHAASINPASVSHLPRS